MAGWLKYAESEPCGPDPAQPLQPAFAPSRVSLSSFQGVPSLFFPLKLEGHIHLGSICYHLAMLYLHNS